MVVQLAAGRADDRDALHDIETSLLAYVEDVDGAVRYEGELALDRSGPIGYTVRVLPHHPLLAGTAELGLVATA